jgi:protein SCO1/2
MRISRRALTMMLTGVGAFTKWGPTPSAAGPDNQFPNVPFLTQDGTRMLFYDDLIKGRVVLINFFFTSCKTVCPRTTENLLQVEDLLGDRLGRDIRMISITVDPNKDTPEVLKEYSRRHGTKAGWYFLTGTRKDIDRVRLHLGVNRYNNDKTDHTGMLVYGNEATRQWAATPAMADPEVIVESVVRLVR